MDAWAGRHLRDGGAPMKPRVVLTRSNEKQITADWHRGIPSLGIYKPRWLLRRVGPLLSGICLERDSSGEIYKPIFHVHCLGKEAPAVFLTLMTQVRSERSGGPTYVEVKWHNKKYEEAAARMIRQALLPLEGDLALGQVLDAYRCYMATPMGRLEPVPLYQDMILLLAWAGNQPDALGLLEDCLEISDAPREVPVNRLQGGKLVAKDVRVIEDPAFGHLGGRAAFEAECRKLIENPALIQQTVDSQISALGVDYLPVSKLIV